MTVRRRKTLNVFGHRRVKIQWELGHARSGSDLVHGEASSVPDRIIVSGATREPFTTLFHEAWHTYARQIGDDDTQTSDDEARRVETFVTDMMLRNKWVLDGMLEERLRLRDEEPE